MANDIGKQCHVVMLCDDIIQMTKGQWSIYGHRASFLSHSMAEVIKTFS